MNCGECNDGCIKVIGNFIQGIYIQSIIKVLSKSKRFEANIQLRGCIFEQF